MRIFRIFHIYFFFCMLLSVYRLYPMINHDLAIAYYKAEDFVRTLPDMTLVQAKQKYACSSAFVQKTIWRTTTRKRYAQDKTFSVIFDMTVKLPVDMCRLIVSRLFHDNELAVEKFLEMPLGKALEWHAWCEQASCRRMAFLPVFYEKFQNEGLDIYFVSNFAANCYSNKKLRRNDDGSCEFCIKYRGRPKAMKLLLDSSKKIKKMPRTESREYIKCLKNTELEFFLDELKIQMFQLTIKDIMLLLTFAWEDKKEYKRTELEQLVDIDKKIEFLRFYTKQLAFSYRNSYSLGNAWKYVIGKSDALPVMLFFDYVFVLPFVLSGVSSRIEQKCCKVPIEHIIQENATKQLLNSVIEASGYMQLLPYRQEIVNNYMGYSLDDEFKITSPFLMPLVMPTLCVIYNLIYGYKEDKMASFGIFIAGLLHVGVAGWLKKNFSSITLLHGGTALASFGLAGLVARGCKWGFAFTKESIFCDELANLLARTDIVIEE